MSYKDNIDVFIMKNLFLKIKYIFVILDGMIFDICLFV